MDPTPEQQTWARLAGICILANFVLQMLGDGVTIIARGGETFIEKARYATENDLLWRVSLLEVGLAWIAIGVMAFALYAVLEPVNKRLAQLALCLRLGASFVGAASLGFRVAGAWLYKASATEGLFTTEQLRTLVSVMNRGGGEGVEVAWMFQGAGATLFFLLFLRSRYLPRALAGLGMVGAAVLIPMSAVMFVFPQFIGPLKLVGWRPSKPAPRATTISPRRSVSSSSGCGGRSTITSLERVPPRRRVPRRESDALSFRPWKVSCARCGASTRNASSRSTPMFRRGTRFEAAGKTSTRCSGICSTTRASGRAPEWPFLHPSTTPDSSSRSMTMGRASIRPCALRCCSEGCGPTRGAEDRGSVSRSSAISPSCTVVPSRWRPRRSAGRAPDSSFHGSDRPVLNGLTDGRRANPFAACFLSVPAMEATFDSAGALTPRRGRSAT